MSVDLDKVKAGQYELVAARWDERTSEPGKPFTFKRHRRGDLIDLDEPTAKRLVKAGAVVEPGSLERAAAARAEAQYRQVLASLPDHLREFGVQHEPSDEEVEESDGTGDGGTGGPGTGTPDAGGTPAQAPPVRPATVEAKGVWVDYAVARGLDREEVSKLNKADIIAAVDRLDAPTA